jgi:plasmid stability protein
MQKKIISFEASEELKEALRVAAFRKSISISALIREILEKELHTTPKSQEDA